MPVELLYKAAEILEKEGKAEVLLITINIIIFQLLGLDNREYGVKFL